jgi:uncharacterized membrane protein
MPYRNLAGWTGTGAIFMAVAALLWRKSPILLSRSQLVVPLIVYLINFGFGAAITLVSLDQRYWIPTGIGVVLGVIPALALWWSAPVTLQDELAPIPVAAVTATPLEAVSK